MQISSHTRWLLVLLLIICTCLLLTHAKGGRGGGGRGGSRGGSRGSTSSRRRPAPAPTSRPAPAPSPRPRPAYRPSPKPAPRPAPSPKPSAPEEPVVARQPASNPNYKETNPVQQSANKQPASNPNYKPDGTPGGPPPPYAPAGQPAPNAVPAAPPPYQQGAAQPPPYGSSGQNPPYPQNSGAYPPAYPGQPGRPPAYPGQSAPYPVQPGAGGQPYPQQPGYPGGYPQQPGVNRPYPVQPGTGGQPYPQQPGYPGGYPQQPGVNRPYPAQPGYPGGYPQQPGMNRPYPVQPGFNYAGGNRPYPQQPLGGNVWRPQSGMPAPAYMNYGGIPTGANMYGKSHKQKGFLGSLSSMGHSKSNYGKQSKYGKFPSPYALGGMAAGGMAGGYLLGKYGRSAAMYTILPFMAARAGSSLFRPSFGFGMMPMFLMMPHYHHYNHGYGSYSRNVHYYDIYSTDYIGKCQKPLKQEHTHIKCKSTYDDIACDAKCDDGYQFPENITLISNRCWHVAGVWRPNKNFPDCKPLCDDDCMNGGECIRPGVCTCPAEFRGDRCQFHFLDCDVRKLTKGEKEVGWVCNHTKKETTCKIRCKEPAIFESPAADEYKCTPQGVWTPDSLPHCAVNETKDGNATVAN